MEFVLSFKNDKESSIGWSHIPNKFNPLSYTIKSYFKNQSNTVKIRTIATFNLYPTLLVNLIKSMTRIIQLYPNCTKLLYEHDDVIAHEVAYYLSGFLGSIENKYDTIDLGNDEVYLVLKDFVPQKYLYYIHSCRPLEKGVEFVVEGSFKNSKEFIGLFDHTVSIQKQVVQNIYDYLTGDANARNMLWYEKEFNKRMCDGMHRFNLLHQNKLFGVYATADFDEVIIKGTSIINDDLENIANLNTNLTKEFCTSPKSKLLCYNERFICFHRDSFMNGQINYPHDLLIGFTRIDGYMFRASTSMFCKKFHQCHYNHSGDVEFELVLDAERLERSNDKVLSMFCCHMYTPFLKQYSPLQRKIFVLNIVNSYIFLRLKLEYNIGDLNILGNCNDLPLEMNHFNSAINAKMQLDNLLKNLKNKEIDKLHLMNSTTKCHITQLDDVLLEKIFTYLPYKDLISCLNVCERFKYLLSHLQHLWKHFFDLHFNPNTFKIRPFNNNSNIDVQHFKCHSRIPTPFSAFHLIDSTTNGSVTSVQDSPLNSNYIDNWHHFMEGSTPKTTILQTPTPRQSNCVVSNTTEKIKVDYCKEVLYSTYTSMNWKNKNRINNYQISTSNPIKILKLLNNQVLSACYEGNWELFNTNLSLNRHVVGHGNIVGANWLEGGYRVIVGYKNGDIRVFDNQSSGYSWIQITSMDEMVFDNDKHLIGYDSKDNVYVYDLQTGLKIIDYFPHNEPITHISKYDDNVFLSSSKDKNVIGFDVRNHSNAFTIKEFYSYVTTFTSFENYLVVGTNDGFIKLYDIRKQELCMDRTPFCSQITSLNCYNRKLVCGNERKAVIYLDCSCGYIGGSQLLYNHRSHVTAITFSDETLVSGSSDGVIISSSFLLI
ncbi:F-box/WD domain containing protein [Entamoeba marina]